MYLNTVIHILYYYLLMLSFMHVLSRKILSVLNFQFCLIKKRLDKKTKECAIAENSARVYESRYNEVNGKYNQALADRKKAEDQAKDLAIENERLRKQLEDLRKQFEAETLARVDLENQNQSLREELNFKDQIHSRELTETRSRRQIEISEIDGRLSKQYEAKLQQSLQELRDQYETQMRANREEIELLYDNEIKNLQAAANRAANSSAHASEEVRLMRTKIDGLNAKIQDLENTNAGLNVRSCIYLLLVKTYVTFLFTCF